ncbi:unnamed protein product [Protopolystoma xenopodis]|uniref:Uncharacterized protein n=1 Tax=Protopolystoma xenopodis TaxID=117903 RepID=A0A448WFF3_9PLAT|nr:unnamed protein product [Protopolystoma xenopodis]
MEASSTGDSIRLEYDMAPWVSLHLPFGIHRQTGVVYLHSRIALALLPRPDWSVDNRRLRYTFDVLARDPGGLTSAARVHIHLVAEAKDSLVVALRAPLQLPRVWLKQTDDRAIEADAAKTDYSSSCCRPAGGFVDAAPDDMFERDVAGSRSNMSARVVFQASCGQAYVSGRGALLGPLRYTIAAWPVNRAIGERLLQLNHATGQLVLADRPDTTSLPAPTSARLYVAVRLVCWQQLRSAGHMSRVRLAEQEVWLQTSGRVGRLGDRLRWSVGLARMPVETAQLWQTTWRLVSSAGAAGADTPASAGLCLASVEADGQSESRLAGRLELEAVETVPLTAVDEAGVESRHLRTDARPADLPACVRGASAAAAAEAPASAPPAACAIRLAGLAIPVAQGAPAGSRLARLTVLEARPEACSRLMSAARGWLWETGFYLTSGHEAFTLEPRTGELRLRVDWARVPRAGARPGSDDAGAASAPGSGAGGAEARESVVFSVRARRRYSRVSPSDGRRYQLVSLDSARMRVFVYTPASRRLGSGAGLQCDSREMVWRVDRLVGGRRLGRLRVGRGQRRPAGAREEESEEEAGFEQAGLVYRLVGGARRAWPYAVDHLSGWVHVVRHLRSPQLHIALARVPRVKRLRVAVSTTAGTQWGQTPSWPARETVVCQLTLVLAPINRFTPWPATRSPVWSPRSTPNRGETEEEEEVFRVAVDANSFRPGNASSECSSR